MSFTQVAKVLKSWKEMAAEYIHAFLTNAELVKSFRLSEEKKKCFLMVEIFNLKLSLYARKLSELFFKSVENSNKNISLRF